MKARALQRFSALFVMTASLGLPVAAPADDAGKRTFDIRGTAVTGFNEVCGEPLQALPLPEPLSPTFHGAFVGAFDPTPGAVAALPLTPENCSDDILLATTTDPTYRAAFGFPDADPRLKNIPLRQVPTTVTLDGLRSALPSLGALPPNPFPPTKSEPNDPVTLGTWLSARGNMRITCDADGSASVKLWLRNLIPNSIYSALAIWRTTPPGATAPTVVALPLGGVPNIMVTKEDGSASFKRRLASCPMDPTPDGSTLLFVDVGYHSDNQVYGAVPVPVLDTVTVITADGGTFSSVLAPGTAAHDHVIFS